MGRMAPKYTAEQRTAAIDLINTHGLKPTEAKAKLETQGHNGLAPFEMPSETIRKLAHEARTRAQITRLAAGDISNGVDTLIRRALSRCDQELSGESDLDTVKKAMEILAQVDKLHKTNRGTKQPANGNPDQNKPPTKLQGLAGTLNTSQGEPPHTPGHNTANTPRTAA